MAILPITQMEKTMRASFVVAYSNNNIFTLDIVAITNQQHVANVIFDNAKDIARWEKKNHNWNDVEAAFRLNLISKSDVQYLAEKPDDMHKNATYAKAERFCDGAPSIRFLDDVLAEKRREEEILAARIAA